MFSQVNHMVRDAAQSFRRRFCGPDIQAAVDLHGVGADDLAVIFFGDIFGQGAFARGGGAGYDQDWHLETRVFEPGGA